MFDWSTHVFKGRQPSVVDPSMNLPDYAPPASWACARNLSSKRGDGIAHTRRTWRTCSEEPHARGRHLPHPGPESEDAVATWCTARGKEEDDSASLPETIHMESPVSRGNLGEHP